MLQSGTRVVQIVAQSLGSLQCSSSSNSIVVVVVEAEEVVVVEVVVLESIMTYQRHR